MLFCEKDVGIITIGIRVALVYFDQRMTSYYRFDIISGVRSFHAHRTYHFLHDADI